MKESLEDDGFEEKLLPASAIGHVFDGQQRLFVLEDNRLFSGNQSRLSTQVGYVDSEGIAFLTTGPSPRQLNKIKRYERPVPVIIVGKLPSPQERRNRYA